MSILELIQSDGFIVKKVSTTNGGEYAGPCPWCQGSDRFRCWPDRGETGRYWCRICGRTGDSIQYLRDYRRLTFSEACLFLGRNFTPPSSLPGPGQRKSEWVPRATASPGNLWAEKARAVMEDAIYHLYQPAGALMLNWLQGKRGLTLETIKSASLGFVPLNRWDSHKDWGLEPVFKDSGEPK